MVLYDDGIGFVPIAQILGGGSIAEIPANMAPAWEVVTRLKEQAPRLGEDPDFTRWFRDGEIDLGCTILSNARVDRQNGVPVSWTVPREGARLGSDALWVPKGLPENEAYWAKQYVNFALSADTQQVWCNTLGLPPTRPRLKPPADLVGDPAYPTTAEDFDRLLQIAAPILVAHQKAWFAKFKEIMQG